MYQAIRGFRVGPAPGTYAGGKRVGFAPTEPQIVVFSNKLIRLLNPFAPIRFDSGKQGISVVAPEVPATRGKAQRCRRCDPAGAGVRPASLVFFRISPLYAAWFSDPRRLLLLRVLVGVTLLAVVWAAERYGLLGQVAPEPVAVDRQPEPVSPPTTDLAATNDDGAEAEAPSLTEVAPRAEAAPRANSSVDRAAAESTAPPASRRSKPTPQEAPRPPPTAADPLVIEGLSLRDSSGRTIYRGQIDLAPTIERIAAGRRLRFPNDGTTFQNRENRLPRRPPGYYREWVVPTPKEPGPGPQRLITGEEGEVWYTHDHYRSFRRLPTEIRIR